MADMHILGGDGKRRWTVVMHFPVPDVNNVVGISYRTALVNSEIGSETIMAEGVGPGQITTAEKVQIEAGELFEHLISFLAESGGTSLVELRDALRAEYARQEANMIAEVQLKLKYFGHTESAV